MSLLKRQFPTGFRHHLRQNFSQDDWTFCTLVSGYFIGWLLFASALLVLSGCSGMEKGFNTDVGLKTVITHAPTPPAVPPTSTLQKSEKPAL